MSPVTYMLLVGVAIYEDLEKVLICDNTHQYKSSLDLKKKKKKTACADNTKLIIVVSSIIVKN